MMMMVMKRKGRGKFKRLWLCVVKKKKKASAKPLKWSTVYGSNRNNLGKKIFSQHVITLTSRLYV